MTPIDVGTAIHRYFDITSPLAQVIAQGTKDRIAVESIYKGHHYVEPQRDPLHHYESWRFGQWIALLGVEPTAKMKKIPLVMAGYEFELQQLKES